MIRQDLISIMITFILGIGAGFYFYLTGYTFEFSDVPKEDNYADFSIEGEAYGGCKVGGCMSFQVLADGSYRVLLTKSEVGEVVKEGVISKSLKNELVKNLSTKTLNQQSQKRPLAKCASDEDGIDYNFRITRADEDYVLDTCKNAIVYESEGWKSLGKLWKYLENLE